MRKALIYCFVLLLEILSATVSAQDKPKAGNVISGIDTGNKTNVVMYSDELDCPTDSFSNSRPVTGMEISGYVRYLNNPLASVHVTERNSEDRIVVHCQTDSSGYFSFTLVDPNDHLQIIYYEGNKMVDIPFKEQFFEFNLEKANEIPRVDIISDRLELTNSLSIIVPDSLIVDN